MCLLFGFWFCIRSYILIARYDNAIPPTQNVKNQLSQLRLTQEQLAAEESRLQQCVVEEAAAKEQLSAALKEGRDST